MANNIQYIPPMNIGQPGSTVRANGGGGWNALSFRDGLDARRTMTGDRVPQAEYPDGYLGTIIDRRQDKVMQSIKGRLTQRSYQRGVHKGERVDPSDYFWDDNVNPEIGLKYEARGQKWTAKGDVVERLVNGGKNQVATPAEMAQVMGRLCMPVETRDYTVIDDVRAKQLKRLAPSWR